MSRSFLLDEDGRDVLLVEVLREVRVGIFNGRRVGLLVGKVRLALYVGLRVGRLVGMTRELALRVTELVDLSVS